MADVYIEFYLLICQALISGLKNNIPTLKFEIAARTDRLAILTETNRRMEEELKKKTTKKSIIKVPVFIGSRTGPPCTRFLALRNSTIEALQ